MIKRMDVAMYTLIKELAADQFEPGLRMFHLADQGVDYATSGGFIDYLVPTIEDLRAQIVAGDILVPEMPST